MVTDDQITQAENFYEKVFPSSGINWGNAVLKLLGNRQDTFIWNSRDDLVKALEISWRSRSGLYVGLARRWLSFVPSRGSQGGKSECAGSATHVIDFDPIPDAQGIKHPLSETQKGEIIRALHASPFNITLIVNSGGGIHAYVIYDGPIAFTDGNAISDFESMGSGIIRSFEIQNLPCHVDRTVSDVSRIMRLPGSYNFKYENPILAPIIGGSQTPNSFSTTKAILQDLGLYHAQKLKPRSVNTIQRTRDFLNGGKMDTKPIPLENLQKILDPVHGCQALFDITQKARTKQLSYVEGSALLSHLTHFEDWRNWFRQELKAVGWDDTPKNIAEIDRFLTYGYAPFGCEKLQRDGICTHQDPQHCLLIRYDRGVPRLPNPIRFARGEKNRATLQSGESKNLIEKPNN